MWNKKERSVWRKKQQIKFFLVSVSVRKMGDTDYSLMDLPAEIREKLAELELELSEGR